MQVQDRTAMSKRNRSTDMLEGAYRFRKAESWNTMLERHIFGVKLDSGEIGYCIVMTKTKKSKDFIQAAFHIFALMGGGI